jgi:hypothetical protein
VMVKKRPTLNDVFSPKEAEGIPPAAQEAEKPRNKRMAINIYLFPEEKEKLRVLAFEERKKIHDLLIEGIDRVLADRGLETITEGRKKR